jgi:hypothetical protein
MPARKDKTMLGITQIVVLEVTTTDEFDPPAQWDWAALTEADTHVIAAGRIERFDTVSNEEEES